MDWENQNEVISIMQDYIMEIKSTRLGRSVFNFSELKAHWSCCQKYCVVAFLYTFLFNIFIFLYKKINDFEAILINLMEL